MAALEDDAYWLPHVQRFLSDIPQSDKAYSNIIPSNSFLVSLIRRLRLSENSLASPTSCSWPRFFAECAAHLTLVRSEPSLASLFSLVFAATCQVALEDECAPGIVFDGLKSCLEICGLDIDDKGGGMLHEICERVLRGIRLLTNYAERIGPRANEIPLHGRSLRQGWMCLQLNHRQQPTVSSSSYTARPTAPLTSAGRFPRHTTRLCPATRNVSRYQPWYTTYWEADVPNGSTVRPRLTWTVNKCFCWANMFFFLV